MKRILWWSGLLIALLPVRWAGAQTPGPLFGEAGHVAISAERLFGFSYVSASLTPEGGTELKQTATNLSLFSNPLAATTSSYSFPRVAVDVFVVPGLTLGTSLAVFYSSRSTPAMAMGIVASDYTNKGLSFTPRVGYAARVSPALALWPRAGMTFLFLSADFSSGTSRGSSSANVIAATFEVPLVISLAPRAALLIGPTVDLSISGKNTISNPNSPETTIKIKNTEFGIQAGLLLLL